MKYCFPEFSFLHVRLKLRILWMYNSEKEHSFHSSSVIYNQLFEHSCVIITFLHIWHTFRSLLIIADKFYENLFSGSGVIICWQINMAKLIDSFSKLFYVGTPKKNCWMCMIFLNLEPNVMKEMENFTCDF